MMSDYFYVESSNWFHGKILNLFAVWGADLMPIGKAESQKVSIAFASVFQAEN